MNKVDRDPEVCGPIITGSRTKEQSETHYKKGEKRMVHVSGDPMSNPAIAKAIKDTNKYLTWPQKSKYPLCYCKVCQGDTQRAECPNKYNPTRPGDSIWFRALKGEPIPTVDRR